MTWTGAQADVAAELRARITRIEQGGRVPSTAAALLFGVAAIDRRLLTKH